jgi:hypothetical protein
MGKKAKCTCGCIFRIDRARHTIDEQSTNSKFDVFETHPEKESSRKSASESVHPDLVKRPRQITNERSMAAEILTRLGYGCPGLIIMAVYFYYTSGLNTALFVTAFGTIGFCVIMYKGISVYRERAAERGMTYEQYKREWGGHKATSPKLKFIKAVFYLSFILLLWLFIIPDEWVRKVRPDFAFGEHWKMALLILILNFPVLLFVATLLMGNWRKYLKISVRLFLWERLPFHYFFKGFWRTFADISREELFGWAATHMLYIWVCFLEYLVIKAIFFS